MESANNDNVNNKYKFVKLVILVTLFLLPVIYLFVSTSKPETVTQQEASKQLSNTDITSLEETTNKNPTFDNLINLSMAYINNQMPGKSINYLKKAIELNPKSAVAYNNLGVAYIMLGQYQNGIDACTKAIEIDPQFQLAKNNLKWGMDEKNKALAAIETMEKTPVDKRTVPFYIDYGMHYFKAGDFDKSIEIWNKIFDLEPKNTVALNNIGTAFMMKNQYEDAILLFKKAIELEPDNQLAKNNLTWAMDEKSKVVEQKK